MTGTCQGQGARQERSPPQMGFHGGSEPWWGLSHWRHLVNAGICLGQRLFGGLHHEVLLKLKLAHLLSDKHFPGFVTQTSSVFLGRPLQEAYPSAHPECATCVGHPPRAGSIQGSDSVVWPGRWPPDLGCFSSEEGVALRLRLSAPLSRRKALKMENSEALATVLLTKG